MQLHTIWFVIVAFFWVGFFVLEGFDFGVGMLHTIVGKTEAERGGAGHDRPVLGRQRGLAGRRRRGHVRGVPRLVRDDVLRSVPGAAARADRADGPRGGVRLPRQVRGPALAAHLDVVHDDRQPADPAAARHRPGRPAGRSADQLQPELHRQLLQPADTVRHLDGTDAGRAVPATRRDVPQAQVNRRGERTRSRSDRTIGVGRDRAS